MDGEENEQMGVGEDRVCFDVEKEYVGEEDEVLWPHLPCHKVSFSDFIYINMNRNAFTDLSGDSVATW